MTLSTLKESTDKRTVRQVGNVASPSRDGQSSTQYDRKDLPNICRKPPQLNSQFSVYINKPTVSGPNMA